MTDDRICRCQRGPDGQLLYECEKHVLQRMRQHGEEPRWHDDGPDDANDPATWPEGQGRFGTRPGHGL